MNRQKLAYDLALLYTKTKFEQALEKESIPIAMNHPQFIEDTSFLIKEFSDMYLELLNSPDLFADIEEWEPKLLDNNE